MMSSIEMCPIQPSQLKEEDVRPTPFSEKTNAERLERMDVLGAKIRHALMLRDVEHISDEAGKDRNALKLEINQEAREMIANNLMSTE